MKLTIAFLQLLPMGCLNGNLEKGISACLQAKEKGADIAIFPEMWSCGYAFPQDETSLRQCAISCDSIFVKQFSALSAELDMAIAVTLLEQHEPKPRNTVCLLNRHDEHLPQINLALVFGEESRLPFYYRKLAGNVPDVKTIQDVQGEYMTNSSLRERFGLPQTSSGSVSRLIKEALDRQLVKPFDPETSNKYMKYVPIWA